MAPLKVLAWRLFSWLQRPTLERVPLLELEERDNVVADLVEVDEGLGAGVAQPRVLEGALRIEVEDALQRQREADALAAVGHVRQVDVGQHGVVVDADHQLAVRDVGDVEVAPAQPRRELRRVERAALVRHQQVQVAVRRPPRRQHEVVAQLEVFHVRQHHLCPDANINI